MLWFTEIFSKDFFEFGSFLVYEHVMFQLRKKNLNLTLDLLFSTFLKLVHVQINCIFFDNTLYIYNIYATSSSTYETQEKICQCYLVLSI